MLRHALALAVTFPIAVTACGDLMTEDGGEASAATAAPTPLASKAEIDRELDPCMAARATEFIDREANDQTRQDLALAVSEVEDIRYVGAGEATNDDLRPDRLNVMMDVEGVITSVGCG